MVRSASDYRGRMDLPGHIGASNHLRPVPRFVPYYDAEDPPHRILAAGDLNVDFDFGHGTGEFARRANTILDRMSTLGLEYMGPQYPSGRRADPTPDHLLQDTKNVVTYYPGNSPETARLQLDRMFASRGFHQSVRSLGFEQGGSVGFQRPLPDID